MNPRYSGVALRAGHRCEYCHAPEAAANFPFEVEHILPRAQGGPDDEANLALACRACNLHKSDALAAADPQTGEVVSLFHPREDVWGEHFLIDADAATIRGITPQGRATVARLNMNGAFQVAARAVWGRLGLFP